MTVIHDALVNLWMLNGNDDGDFVPIEYKEILRNTGKAIQFTLVSGTEIWIPKSLLAINSDGNVFVRDFFYEREIAG